MEGNKQALLFPSAGEEGMVLVGNVAGRYSRLAKAFGLLVGASTLEGLNDQLRRDITRWSVIIKDTGIKASD